MRKTKKWLLCVPFLAVLFRVYVFLTGQRKPLAVGEMSSLEISDSGEITMSLNSEGSSVHGSALSVSITNNTQTEFIGEGQEDFLVEVLKEGKWYSLQWFRGIDRHGVSVTYPPGEEKVCCFDWSLQYGVLPPGDYRVVKRFLYRNPDWDVAPAFQNYCTLYASVEFQVE